MGVPLIVIVFDPNEADTPAGKPFAPDTPLLAIPVAPVVVCVTVVITVLIHTEGDEEAAPTVLFAGTVIVPVAVFVPPVQPPVIVTV